MYLHCTLIDLKKRDPTAVNYFNKLKALTDELALARNKMNEDNINGLDSEYNALVEAVSGRIDQGITLSEVYSMLLTTGAHVQAQNAETDDGDFFINLASRNGYSGGGRNNGGNHSGGSRGNDGRYDGPMMGVIIKGVAAIMAVLKVDVATVVEVAMEVAAITPSKAAIVLATMVHCAKFVLSQVI
jgi:hypothetical protein